MNKINKIQDSKVEIHFFSQEARRKKIIINEAWKLEDNIKEILQLIGIYSMSNKYLLTIDVGCGMGGWSIMLAKEGFNVVAIDIASQSIKNAKNKFGEEELSVPTIIGDVTKAPFRPKAFNICFCAQVLHHFPNLNFIVFELSRILRNNGLIILFEPNGSNIIFKIIRFVKEMIPKKWMEKRQMTTMNESAHDVKSYDNILKSNDFITSKISYYLSAEQALPYQKQVIKWYFHDYGVLAGILLFLRYISLRIVLNMLPENLGMGSVLMTARKHS